MHRFPARIAAHPPSSRVFRVRAVLRRAARPGSGAPLGSDFSDTGRGRPRSGSVMWRIPGSGAGEEAGEAVQVGVEVGRKDGGLLRAVEGDGLSHP